jgi:hypothetical protein
MNIRVLLVGLLIGAVLMFYASYRASIKPYAIHKVRTMTVFQQLFQTLIFGFKTIWLFLFWGLILFACIAIFGRLLYFVG